MERFNQVAFYIPSFRRAKGVTTLKIVPHGTLVVPKSQEAEYREANPGAKIWAIPDEADGNAAKKRNYILKNAPEKYIVMMDDDYSTFGRFFGARGKVSMFGREIEEITENAFILCDDLGTGLWGVNQLDDPQAYRHYTPFSLTSPILGPFMGFVCSDDMPLFDERLYLKEDYDYSIQACLKYRRILRINRYFYQVEHIGNKGGCVSERTREREQEQINLLVEKWGSDIVKVRKNTINPLIKIPIPGV
jgi:hypothetical protein